MKRGHDFYQMPSHQREFLDEVKGDVEKMRKLYGSLIENAQIGDLTASSKDGFQTNVTASALVSVRPVRPPPFCFSRAVVWVCRPCMPTLLNGPNPFRTLCFFYIPPPPPP